MAVTVRRSSHPRYVLADCQASDVAGDMVRVSSDEISGAYQVTKMDISKTSGHHPAGMIIQKLSSTRCAVQMGGEIKGVYSGLTPGKPLFIDLSSRLTHTVPTHPATGVKWVHPAALALSSSAVLLRIQRPSIIRA